MKTRKDMHCYTAPARRLHRLGASLLLSFGACLAAASATVAQVPVAIATDNTPKLEVLERGARSYLEASYPATWDREKLITGLERSLGELAATPLAEGLVLRWLSIARSPGASAKFWKRLLAFESRKDLFGTARILLQSAKRQRAEERGDFEEADRIDPTRDYVERAIAIGPFGDSAGNYQHVLFPVELETLSEDAKYRGRFGDELQFRLVKRSKGNGALRLAPMYPASKTNGCQYGIVQLESKEPGPAWLEFRCSGAFEIWWNGSRIADIDRLTKRPPIRLYFPTPLRAGWNRLVVKTCSTTVSTVQMRFVDDRAQSLPGLRFEDKLKFHDVAEAGPEIGYLPFRDIHSWLSDLSEMHDKSALLLALRGDYACRYAASDEGLAMSKAAYERSKNDPLLVTCYLEAVRLARHMPRDLVRTTERALFEKHAALIEKSRHLFFRHVARLFDDDRREDALKLLEARLLAHPREIDTLMEKRRLFGRMRWSGESEQVLNELRRLLPHDVSLLLSKARILRGRDSYARARKLVEQELQDRPGHRSLLQMAKSLAASMGDAKAEKRYLARLHRRDPKSAAAIKAEISLLEAKKDYEAALQALEGLLERFPRDLALRRRIADLSLLKGDKPRALEEYRAVLAAEADDHDLRREIRRLSEKEYLSECAPFHLDAMAEVASYKKRPEDEGAPSTLILDQMIIRVYKDGSMMEETHQLRRINDRNGVEAHEEAAQASESDELLELRTIFPDGSWYSPHEVSGTFSMPRLEPGAFVEERYRNYKRSPGLLPINFATFYFQNADEPFRFSRLVVILPKEQKIGRFLLRNFPKASLTTQDLGSEKAYIFLRENMPRLEPEPLMPPIEDFVPVVTFGRDYDMAAHVRRLKAVFASRTYAHREVREKTQEITSGAESDREKARRIHKFVHALTPDTNQRRGSADPVSVLLKGEGDRFGLQLAMLRAAGVPWVPAMIHAVSPAADTQPEAIWNNPGYYFLNAAIVKPKGSEEFWVVQGTPRYFPFAKLPDQIGGNALDACPYLILEGSEGVPGRLPGLNLADYSGTRMKGTLKLVGRDAKLRAELFMQGAQGYGMKEIIKSQNANARTMIGRQITSQILRGYTMEAVHFDGLEEGKTMRIVLDLTRRNFVRRFRGGFALPPLLPPSSMTRRFATRSERRFDFVWGNFVVADYDFTIDLGEHRLEQAPRGLLARKFLIDYGLSFDSSAHRLHVTRKMLLRPGRIRADRFPEWIDLCRQIDATEMQPIRLRKD